MKRLSIIVAALLAASSAQAGSILLKPAAVFDGQEMHAGWSVLVTDDKIAAAGANLSAPAGARSILARGDG